MARESASVNISLPPNPHVFALKKGVSSSRGAKRWQKVFKKFKGVINL